MALGLEGPPLSGHHWEPRASSVPVLHAQHCPPLLFFFFWPCWDRAQGLPHARQVLSLNHTPAPHLSYSWDSGSHPKPPAPQTGTPPFQRLCLHLPTSLLSTSGLPPSLSCHQTTPKAHASLPSCGFPASSSGLEAACPDSLGCPAGRDSGPVRGPL
jgi:hypothetical protein